MRKKKKDQRRTKSTRTTARIKMKQSSGITSTGISMILVNPARITRVKWWWMWDVYVSERDTKLIEGWNCKGI